MESVGDGRVGGKVKEFTTKPGDTVLYSKFGLGATELEVGGREFILIREVSSLKWGHTALLLACGVCCPCQLIHGPSLSLNSDPARHMRCSLGRNM